MELCCFIQAILFAKLHFQKLYNKADGHKINCIFSEKKNARCRYCALYSKMCSHSSYKLQYVIKLKHYNLGKIKLPEYKAHALIIMVFESFRYWVQSPNFNVRKFEHSLIIWPTLTI